MSSLKAFPTSDEVTKLVKELRTAVAWGCSDRESLGYSNSEFVDLCSRALDMLEAFIPAARKDPLKTAGLIVERFRQ